MDLWQESRCPVCRHSYHHFPGICWLLHSVLLKLYPKVCQRRESQVTEMEKSRGIFSPQFENYLGVSHCSEKMPADGQEHGKDCAVSKSLEPPPDNICTKGSPKSSSDKITENKEVKENSSSGSDHVEDCYKKVNITDLLCAICKELLYRPVVLNCGHVFCEACVIDSSNESCRCPVCQSSHPKGFPKVCLVLEGFLEQHVSEEYAARRQTIDKLKTREQGTSSAGSTEVQEGAQRASVPMNDYLRPDLKVHFGVGCDCCGIYPLTGNRYKCKDCLEKIGFDLCEDCYNSSSNLPGRFNQQHKPDHKFEVLEPQPIIFLSSDFFPETRTNVSTAPDSSLDQRDPEADVVAHGHQEDPEADVVAHGPTNDTTGDQEDIGPTP
ncbi:proteolysis 1 [Artemisia annua]|uniref:Proteolysis 1 n=1 Tax=Artemisia annua TaxID=35608 RepID=A0A2U1Q6E0_ARTAN|nr:proteolysis 1 [Artemisia annua]